MTLVAWVDGLTIGEVLSRTAGQFPDRDAIVFCQPDQQMTWQQLDVAVDCVACGLLALGLQRGDHFGVWATNWPEWVLLQFATARIGVVLVTINPSYRPFELAYTLEQSQVRGLAMIDHFKSTQYDEMLYEICPEMETVHDVPFHCRRFPHLETIIRMRGSQREGMLGWNELCDLGETVTEQQWQMAKSWPVASDPINLQYTSGTTGRPKGALLTHRNLLLNAFYAGECQNFTERDRICIPVPLYHCFGCVLGTLAAAVRGAAMVFPCESFRAEETLEAIESEQCTAIYGVPTMFIALLEDTTFQQRKTSSLRTGIMAGSPCPIELMKRVTTDLGASEITIGYGQTEASPLITMTRADDPIEKRVGTVGKVIPGVEAKIVDQDSGLEVADGQSGELCSRGHNVMLGYFNNLEATKKSIDDSGWLHTGDLALRQSDGYFRITGRLTDMIIRGGENIYPREIEELLYTHPVVEDVQVLGLPDPRFGEEVLACIRRRNDLAVDEKEIRDFCRHHLSHFKAPRYVWFLDEFPTTVTGKIQKFKLREMAIKHFELKDAAAIETA